MMPKTTTNPSVLMKDALNKMSTMNARTFRSKDELFEKLLNVGCETINKYKSKYNNILITYILGMLKVIENHES